MPVVSFLVSSASTSNDACQIAPYYLVYSNPDVGVCDPCTSGGLNCWPCLRANIDSLYIDSGCTIPVQTGYYSNEFQTGTYATIYVVNGLLQPAGFMGCSVLPTVTPTSTLAITPTQTPTNTETPTVTPTNTSTPTNTPTNTNTPSVTPTNTPTPSVTPPIPTPTATPIPSYEINFKTIADSLQRMATLHKQINSYGLGDTDQMSYWTQMRLDEDNPTFESPFFPLLYIVPSRVLNGLRYKNWEFNMIMSDIVDRDLTNQVDVLSDTLQILQDVVSQYRLSVQAQFGCYNNKFYVDESVQFIPFLEKYSDLTNGWNAIMRINTMTPLDRCAAAYNIFTGTPIVHDSINFKTFHDDFRLLADHHKQLNSFGFGALEDLSYWTESRLKQDNPTYESPFFPLLYVVPSDATQIIEENGSSFTQFDFNVIVMDILDRDLINQVDVLSDTNQILDDIISQFRLSVRDSLGCFNQKYYLDDPVECQPFMEQYSDLCGGWSGLLRIKVMTPLDRCAAAFDTFLTPTATVTPSPTSTPIPSPSVTPTNTETPTNTPTQTATPTCPVTTQYLEVQLQDSSKFKLILWNQPDFTSPAVALCDYIISGCAYGSLGTIYCGTETINEGQHQHQFDLAPVLQPTEDVIAFDVLSYTASTCICPVNLILPVGPTPTPTVTQTQTPSETPTSTPSETPTQTPTNTSTSTPTQTSTQTQTQTPTNTSTNTPTPTSTPIPSQTQTPTVTPTNTITPSITPTNTPGVRPTFTNLWDWWISDTGVSTNAVQGITGWTGLNGNILTPQSVGTNLAQYISTDSLFNNQPSVFINTGLTTNAGYKVATSTAQTSKTILMAGYVVNTNQVTTNQSPIIGIGSGNTPRMTLFGKSSNQFDVYTLACGEIYTGSTWFSGYSFSRITYNRTSGGATFYYSSANTFNTVIAALSSSCPPASQNFTAGDLEIGIYNVGGYQRTPQMRIVEFLLVDGIPTTTELNNYTTYLNYKYNI